MPKKKVQATIDTNINDVVTISDWIYGGLLLVVVAIMPLVVRFAMLESPPELYAMYRTPWFQDFFSYYKGWLIGVPATFIVIYFLVEMFFEKYKGFNYMSRIYKPEVIAAGVFLWMALLSTIFTSYRHTSWRGAVDRGEGMWILLAYFIIFFTAFFYVRKARHAKYLLYGLAFSSIIMGLIGLSQFLERDFFETVFGQWFLLLGIPEHARETVMDGGGIGAQFEMANGTLYNPNTFGKYTAMVAPILLAAGFAYDEDGWIGIGVRTALFLGGGMMLIGVFGSRSLGGFIGIAAAVGVAIVTIIVRFLYQLKARKKEDDVSSGSKRQPIGAWIAGAGVVAVLVASLFLIPVVNDRLSLALTRFDEALRGEPQPMDEMNFAGDRFTLVTNGYERFTMAMSEVPEDGPVEGESWRIYDITGQQLNYTNRRLSAAGGPVTYTYAIPGYRNIDILVFPDAITFRMIGMRYENGRIYGVAPNDDTIDMHVPIPAIGFYGRESWGSARGYIWSRTIPLMSSRVILGSGPDTFTQVFPQEDIVAKMFLFPSPYVRIDKAHNVFLQTWITTGGISALALIFLFAYYLLTTFISLVCSKMEEGSFVFALRFGLLTGIAAYILGAMSTDSTIGSSGVFYLLLGLGFGLNYMVKAKANEAK
ncbi:MAG: O-antigen ligase family protein [Defluviitaleaceae bacterium]|nr:O-antigen ligase family protein [Defluviitaleaceae bacterium]